MEGCTALASRGPMNGRIQQDRVKSPYVSNVHDGTARILGMRADGGQNAETAYCQIAADELGMRIEDVCYRPQTRYRFLYNDSRFFHEHVG